MRGILVHFSQSIAFSLLVLFSLSSFDVQASSAHNYIASIFKLRGEASMLGPHDLQAIPVKRGLKLKADTSILTGPSSFVIIKYTDNSRVTLGPKSKIVIKKKLDHTRNVVNLLIGNVKASIDKRKKSKYKRKNKFIIKTRTAAMGVRGTEFKTSYNPANKITSLVTFEGKVAMVKLDKHKEIVKMKNQAVPTVEVNLDKELEKKNVVVVEVGRYAGVSPNLKGATKPVVISPKQFTLMKLNTTLTRDNHPKKEVFKEELEKTKKTFAKLKLTKKDSETKFDPKQGSLQLLAGGFVDEESGLYIPPQTRSVYDKKLKVFKVTSKIGTVDDSGHYIPPKGLKLDADKGFVPDGKDQINAVALARNLNRNIAGQMVKPKKSSKAKLDDIEELEDNAYDRYFKLDDE